MRLEPPSWWYSRKMPALAWGLFPISLAYGTAVKARFQRTVPYKSKLPVICAGNFTMGGAGKTPTALMLAGLLKAAGWKPAFLTRGYGGSERGPYLVVPGRDGADKVGDEALLLSRIAPTIVSRSRPDGARLIETLGADIIVMDDGFQNPSLEKDFNLVVIDGGAGLGSSRVFPMGPLRAPLAFQAALADAILVINAKGARLPVLGKDLERIPRFDGTIAPLPSPFEFRGQKVVAYCAIGRPSKFFATLEETGAIICKRRSFPDHHSFSEAEAKFLMDEARVQNARLVTTEKDLARLEGKDGSLKVLREQSAPLPVHLEISPDRQTRLMRLISASCKP